MKNALLLISILAPCVIGQYVPSDDCSRTVDEFISKFPTNLNLIDALCQQDFTKSGQDLYVVARRSVERSCGDDVARVKAACQATFKKLPQIPVPFNIQEECKKAVLAFMDSTKDQGRINAYCKDPNSVIFDTPFLDSTWDNCGKEERVREACRSIRANPPQPGANDKPSQPGVSGKSPEQETGKNSLEQCMRQCLSIPATC
ncbi:hypothetical protein CDD81_6653 [Ophiocordyceps australis]|uniref:Uncharacterized protein n=1 Tax=Ophiocordyceps australis TaxID=1399860 RepID=A0A2C5Y5F5_9HYPO|nr:hypothetical protein CDD81_6653 [Ophiocordyceps australis]